MGFAFNSVQIGGYMATDVQALTYGSAGGLLAKFTISVSNYISKQNNTTLFLDCVMFGKHVEYVAKNLSKGDRVFAQGYLQQENWTSKTGEKRRTIKLMVNKITGLERKGTGGTLNKPEFGDERIDKYIGGAPNRDDFRPPQPPPDSADAMLNDAPF